MTKRIANSRQRARPASGLAPSARQAIPLLPLLLVALSGCNGFFVKPTSTSTTTPTTSPAADYAYVANSSAGINSLSEYNVGSGSLLSVGTINLGFVPVALSVAPSNSHLYVAAAPGSPSPGIYLYSIATGGGLTVANNGIALATDSVAAMTISPDGNWLFTVNSDGLTMNEYKVDTSTGGLTPNSPLPLPGVSCLLGLGTPATQTCSVAASPSGNYVVASVGTSGDAVFPYSSTLGITGKSIPIASGYSTANATGDFSVAMDNNNYAYIARTSTLGVYSLGSTIANTYNPSYVAGTVPRSVVLNKAYTYVFTANEGTGTISSFGIGASGSLTAVTGSPFPGPRYASALGVDNTGTYMVAVGYDASAGVRLYLIASTGVLAQVAVAASGTNIGYPALVAMTH